MSFFTDFFTIEWLSSQFFHRLGNTHFQSSQFSQSSQTAQTRVTRIGLLLQIVNHLMTVVRTHRNRYLTTLLHEQEVLHYMIHVYISFQVISFMEVTFGITLCAAQVYEINTVAPAFQRHKPLDSLGTASTSLRKSSSVLMIRGKPKID